MGYRRRADGGWDYTLPDHPKIGYIWIDSFGEETAAELRDVFEATLPNIDALILDLRRNAGGLLNSAVEVCDLFISEGAIVTIKGRNGILQDTFEANDNDDLIPVDLPVAILVDHFSASAAEIFAACLQDYGRAKIVGERSWGKGTVQNVIELEGGRSAMRLTTATYWRPSGKNIHRSRQATDEEQWGVSPTEEYQVSFNEEEAEQFVRSQRDRFAAPVDSPASQDATSDDEDASAFVDRQLQRAIEYIETQISESPQLTRDAA